MTSMTYAKVTQANLARARGEGLRFQQAPKPVELGGVDFVNLRTVESGASPELHSSIFVRVAGGRALVLTATWVGPGEGLRIEEALRLFEVESGDVDGPR